MKNLFLLFLFSGICRAAAPVEWSEASPEVLRERLFGVRYFLMHEDKGPAAKAFLESELARNPTMPVKAYLARVCLLGPELDGAWPVEDLRGRKLAVEAIREGSAVAADLLGRIKLYGPPELRDEAAGMEYIQKAAELGHPRALARYGFSLMLGKGGQHDFAAGEAMIRKAAALGATDGLRDVALAYENGWQGAAPDLAKALEYYYQMAIYNDGTGNKKLEEFAQKGVPGAELAREIARVRFANDDGVMPPAIARRNCEKLEALNSNDPRAWLELGVAYLYGEYVSRNPAKALDYLRRAAAAGEAEAKFFLAQARMEGWGQPRAAEAGLKEMQALADAGDARAANRLGILFYWGASHLPGGKKDPVRAFKYVRQGAQNGYGKSLLNLGFCYEQGIGTPENYALATLAYWEAYDRGYKGIKGKVYRNLTFAKIP